MSKRNEPPKELVKVGEEFNYLAAYVEADKSTEGMDEYRILPRIKIIQSMTDQGMKDEHGEGSVILNPGSVLLADKKGDFGFVPLFFFPEWCKWADRRDKANPAIMARSFDKGSDLAIKAKMEDTRFEEYEGGPESKPFKARFVEHLNFAGIIYGDHEAVGTTCVLSFSRGEYGKGRGFISAIKMRRLGVKQAPLWCQVWTLKPGFRDRGDKKWFGIDWAIPQIPFITKEEMEAFKNQHEILKTDYEAKRLVVNRLDEDADADTAENGDAANETKF